MFSRILICTLCLCCASAVWAADIDEARRAISNLRYNAAQTALVDIARSSGGNDKQEALFLLAGLKKSVPEAEIIYQEVIRIDESNRWARKAQIEMAKIQYAVGNYNQAFDILETSASCGYSLEGCYFQGLSAMMLSRYGQARETLGRVKGGKYRTWANLSLAELEAKIDNEDDACRKYRSMARSFINPTAMYRYAECLEKEGQIEQAVAMFREIRQSFGHTPEALLAEQKLHAFDERAKDGGEIRVMQQEMPLDASFTIQFGAFNDRTNAIKLAAQIKRNLPAVRIDSDLLNYKEVHRVRYGYFRNRAQAERMANEISSLVNEPYTIMTLQ